METSISIPTVLGNFDKELSELDQTLKQCCRWSVNREGLIVNINPKEKERAQ